MSHEEEIKEIAQAISKEIAKAQIKTTPLNQSEEIKELVISLAKAQGKMEPAVFNKTNPHFKSRYADFTSVMNACRVPLSENGLAVMQYCETIEGKLMLVTMLAHTSGQWMKSFFPLNPASMTSQHIGSAMTYAKRYSLSAMLGIVADDDDDDAEAATKQEAKKPEPKKPEAKKLEPNSDSIPMPAKKVAVLKNLYNPLTKEFKEKIMGYMTRVWKTEVFEDLPEESFEKIYGTLENALKLMESQIEPQYV